MPRALRQSALRQHLPSPFRILVALAIALTIATSYFVVEVIRQAPDSGGYIRTNGDIYGGDFLAFYVGGRLFLDERDHLYDLSFQREFRNELLREKADELVGELPFVYPPLVAASLSPLSRLPYGQAYAIWVIVGLAASIASLLVLMRTSGATSVVPLPILLLGVSAFFPFTAQTFLGGQASSFGVAILAATCVALLHQQPMLAGVIFSLSYYKPPLYAFLLVVLILGTGRRFALGFAIGAALLLTGNVLAVGVDGSLHYLQVVSGYVYGRELLPGWELSTAEGMGLWALIVNLSPSLPVAGTLLTFSIFLVGWVCVALLRSDNDSTRLYGLVLSCSASLAFSVQLLKYDLALLLVPMILAVAWLGTAADNRRHARLLMLAFVPFYFELLARRIPAGSHEYNLSSVLFVALIAALTIYGTYLLRREPAAAQPEPR